MTPTASSKSPIATDIVKGALRECSKRAGRKITYRDLAETLDVNKSSMWFPVKGKRSWVVDRWLLTLQALGCLSYKGDKIIISSNKLSKYEHLFNGIETL